MPKRRIYLEDIPLEEARAKLQAALEHAGRSGPLEGESVRLEEALGRVTAEPVHARRSSPHFHCAAMDGYAVRAADTISARETQALTLRLGTDAFPVNTGDPLPESANAVIMIENVNQADADSLLIYASVAPWQHVRLMGEDMVETETVLQVNHVLRPVDIGALAGCGHHEVAVRRKPRALIIPTGSEMLPHDEQPKRGQLTEYNSLILGGQIRAAGGEATVTDIVEDDFDKLRNALQDALSETPDLILVLSGSSAGAHDFTAAAIRDLGDVLVHGVAVRPGHPVIIGMAAAIPVIGIPGYPVSAALTGELFVLPLIHRWLGLQPPAVPTVEAVSTRKIASPIGDDDFVRVALAEIDGQLQATPLQRGAGVITSLVRADGLAHIPRFHEGVDRGGTLKVSLYQPPNLIRQTAMIMGSHDPMLDLLATHLRLRAPDHRIVSVNVGSLGGLIALRRGEAHVAGCHLLDPDSATYNVSYVQRYTGDEAGHARDICSARAGTDSAAGQSSGNHFDRRPAPSALHQSAARRRHSRPLRPPAGAERDFAGGDQRIRPRGAYASGGGGGGRRWHRRLWHGSAQRGRGDAARLYRANLGALRSGDSRPFSGDGAGGGAAGDAARRGFHS